MSLLSNLATDDSIENEKDSLGSGSRVRESGLYPMTIDLAYVTKSKSEALALNLVLKDGAGEIKQQLWMTSGKEKGCKNYYEKDGEKFYLPGFLQANALCLLTVGKEISVLDTEDKVISLYNFDAKSEVPTKVPMLTELLGKEILVGLIKQTVDKNVKDATGNYVPSGETRDENEVDKMFRASDRKTTAEIRAGSEAEFADKWAEKWAGKTKDKSTKGAAGTAGAPAKAGGQPGSGNKPTQSLFGSN